MSGFNGNRDFTIQRMKRPMQIVGQRLAYAGRPIVFSTVDDITATVQRQYRQGPQGRNEETKIYPK